MWNKASAAIIILLIILSAVGCSSTGCLENRNSVPYAGFYDGKDQKIVLDSVEIIGLGMPEDDPLSGVPNRISSIYLPMKATEPSTTWLFKYRWKGLNYPQFIDTIAFHYETIPYFSSYDCGVIYKYSISKVDYTTHLVDSIVLVDSLITNLDVEQIKIYFRTAEEEPDQPEETSESEE